jgi:hypothetical protein
LPAAALLGGLLEASVQLQILVTSRLKGDGHQRQLGFVIRGIHKTPNRFDAIHRQAHHLSMLTYPRVIRCIVDAVDLVVRNETLNPADLGPQFLQGFERFERSFVSFRQPCMTRPA